MELFINVFSSIVYIIKNKLLQDSSRLGKHLSKRQENTDRLQSENRNQSYGYVCLEEKQDFSISDRDSVKSTCKQKADLHSSEIGNLAGIYKGLRRLILTLVVLDVLLIMIVIIVISTHFMTFEPDTAQLQTGSKHKAMNSHRFGNHLVRNVYCVSCKSVRDIDAHLFQTTEDGSCCMKGLIALIQLVKAFSLKTFSKHRSDLERLQKVTESGIMWRAHVKDGELWHDIGGVYIDQGGRYFVYCKIHFSKQVCDGSEKFEFRVYQVYNYGMYFPVAHAQKGCVNGSRFDDHLMVQSVVDIELGQNATINIQYDSRYHRFIDRTLETHMMGLFEI